MQLSVIILNYNVKYFLEQALHSVRKALVGIDAEVIVIDNNSVDGSVAMVQDKFPEVVLIANRHNPGFAAGNNQGLRIAQGQYVLLLNPDTVVAEDTFRQCIAFMDSHPQAGAVGVRMYDGKGNFLPESKRGLPTPLVAFYKMVGLGALFPRSRRFNYYYLGHLSDQATHSIEVLSGAFMFMRRSVLDQVGLLDEAFFMYGEDVDLSYRITQAGYPNFYLHTARIIHYKGESTKRGSLNYVRMFYNAMLIFARKHYSGNQQYWFVWGIQAAIYSKAALSVLQQALTRLWLPLADGLLLYGIMFWLKNFWQNNIKAAVNLTYPPQYMLVNVPLYVGIWLLSVYLSGGYDPPPRLWRVVRGLLAGTVVISAVYGFLPEALRFSRGMLVAGAVLAVFVTALLRLLLHFVQHRNFNIEQQPLHRTIIVGSLAECQRVHTLLHQTTLRTDLLGYVQSPPHPIPANEAHPTPTPLHPQVLGYTYQLADIVQIYHIDEIIFCGQDLASQQIIQFMIDIGQQTDYKIVPPASVSIIGSNSKNTAGDLYALDIKLHLTQPRHRRNKRLLDLSVSLLLLLLLPLLLLRYKVGIARNALLVIASQRTWVGYADHASHPANVALPPLPQGVLSPANTLPVPQHYEPAVLYRLNLLYAKDYDITTDLQIIAKAYRHLDRP